MKNDLTGRATSDYFRMAGMIHRPDFLFYRGENEN